MRRGQVGYQAVVTVMIGVMIVGTLVLGARWLLTLRSSVDSAEMATFQYDLITDFEGMARKHGSFVVKDYNLPVGIERICILDTNHAADTLGSIAIQNEPVMADALQTPNGSNVFLFSDTIEGDFRVDEIAVGEYPYFVCRRQDGTVSLGLEGKGGKVRIMTEKFTSADIRTSGATVVYSSDGIMKVEVQPGSTSATDISVSIDEPDGGSTQLSERYQMEPSGATFNPPLVLTIDYASLIVGECPSELTFTYTYDGGGSVDIPSDSINCDQQTATFLLDRI